MTFFSYDLLENRGNRFWKHWDEAIPKQKRLKDTESLWEGSCSASCNTGHSSLLMDQEIAAAAAVHRHLCSPCSATNRLHWEPNFIYAMRNMFPEVCVVPKDLPATCRASAEAPPWDAAGRAVKAESSWARWGDVLPGNICGRHWHQL